MTRDACPALVVSRSSSLGQVNSVLREQLEQAGAVTQGLTESLSQAREDAELSDSRLRREQEVKVHFCHPDVLMFVCQCDPASPPLLSPDLES